MLQYKKRVLQYNLSPPLSLCGRKFDQQAAACNETYTRRCAGPSRATYAMRLQRAAQRERAAFLQSYNARLFNGLLMGAVGGIVVFRFLIRVSLLELASWLLFVFLEVSPKLYLGKAVLLSLTLSIESALLSIFAT